MNEDNKSIEEIIAISYFDADNMNIKNHVDRYFEIKRDIINVLNKYNVMWVLTDTNGFNNNEKEIKRLNNIISELEKELKNRIKNVPDTMVEVYEDKSILNKLQELKRINEPTFEEMVNFVENVCKDIKNQPTLDKELEGERERIAKVVNDFKGADKE